MCNVITKERTLKQNAAISAEQREKMMFTFKTFQAQNANHQIIRHTQKRQVVPLPAILFTCDNNDSATRWE